MTSLVCNSLNEQENYAFELAMFQTSISSLESKHRQCNCEVAELQAKVGEYERLLEDNRSQVCCLLLLTIIVLLYIP